MVNIGIIGAGKVGVSLGKYLVENKICVRGFYSRTKESANEAAKFTQTNAYDTIGAVVTESDVLFITTSDDSIENMWEQIKTMDLTGKIVCHFSGVLSSEIFEGIENSGGTCCSVHPVHAFSDKFTSYMNFNTAHVVIEGMENAVVTMKSLFEKLGHCVHTISTQNKAKYHAAAAICSNHVLALLNGSFKLLEECGFNEQSARDMLSPLIQGNIASALNKGCVGALTGPIERNDIETVEMHLNALKDNFVEDAYLSTAALLIELAKEKNPDRCYDEMSDIIESKITGRI